VKLKIGLFRDLLPSLEREKLYRERGVAEAPTEFFHPHISLTSAHLCTFTIEE
jgi:hypothetical protein